MHLVDTTLFYSPTSGGVKRYLSAKHAWLAQHTPHRHSILVPGARTRLLPGGVSTVAGMRLPATGGYRLPLSPRRWADLLSALTPDLIEVGDAFHPAWCAWQAARPRSIPLVAFFHSNLVGLVGRRCSGLREPVIRYLRWLYGHFDLVFAPSHVMCSLLQEFGIRHVALQPLGVDTQTFSPLRRTLDLRGRLGLAPDTRLLVYAGRFSAEKNLDVLQDAVTRLGPPYHVLLIGGTQARRLSAQISVLPYRRDGVELAQWLASADALVHAGSEETFGLVVLEAMACARPVVAVRAGALPELVDEQVGQLAKPLSAASLAQAIEALYQRDLDALGRAAHERVLRRFSWDSALQLQLAGYARVCGPPRAAVQPYEAVGLR
jgi:alpha-1,6-mannosyltransferase